VQIFESLSAVPPSFGPSAVAIGKFDGMHAGHQSVLAELRLEAALSGLTSVALTFDRHPLSLLRPELCPNPLISNAQKLQLIEKAGIDAALMLSFDKPFSELTPREFVQTILSEAVHTKSVLVGADFRFGVRGSGTVEILAELGREYGFSVRTVHDVLPVGLEEAGRRASSTWIRELLDSGQVADAARLLGRLPTVRAVVVGGAERGRKLGYPTANLSREIEGYVPADGVYAAKITIHGDQFGAAVSVGNNPTFDGVPDKQVEAHVLDQKLDLYGKVVELGFVDYIRPMKKFPDAAALVAQMAIDDVRIREVLGIAES
jgi:riboflavin kinase / FMN adenylyltransferase